MWTYRDSQLNFATDTWPAGATEQAGDKTTWNYDAATGLLTSKVDAAGNAVSYTYYDDGKLHTRTWARGDVTTYSYYPTGELHVVDYSDPETPDVTYTYDALGRVETVTDAVGVRTMVYDPDTLQLVDEVIDGQGAFEGAYDLTLHRKYEDAGGVAGRPAGMRIGDGSDYDVTYGYEAGTGRLQRVGWNVDGQSDEAVYGYVPNSNLLAGMATTSGQTTTYGYEPHRDLKTLVRNQFDAGGGPTTVSQFDYRYDAIGRRTDVVTTGSAFGGVGNEELSLWDYNDRNEVVGSARHAGVDPQAPGAAVPSEARSYQFDPIGNRETALGQDGVTSVAYGANQLNQYGAVADTALTYDLDGNMLDDGSGRVLQYNGENRLVRAERGQEFSSTFTYDYLGRRVRKEVDTNDDGVWDYRVYFAYDGWNVVREVRENNGQATTTKRYVWGLDLSDSMQGAGGVGGLVATIDDAGQSAFTFDGHGNVSELVTAADGAPSAHYEYDAFGNAVVASGVAADDNAWRFSTKPVDEETGHSYYGYRWYAPAMGRWNRKDPTDEALSGSHLYAMVGNRPTTAFDYLGLLDPSLPGYVKIDLSEKLKKNSGVTGGGYSIKLVYERADNCKCKDGYLAELSWGGSIEANALGFGSAEKKYGVGYNVSGELLQAKGELAPGKLTLDGCAKDPVNDSRAEFALARVTLRAGPKGKAALSASVVTAQVTAQWSSELIADWMFYLEPGQSHGQTLVSSEFRVLYKATIEASALATIPRTTIYSRKFDLLKHLGLDKEVPLYTSDRTVLFDYY